MADRSTAFARLFEAVHEGVYIGTINEAGSTTVAANAHLKVIFGYPAETPDADVRPFDPSRFIDPHARGSLLDRLSTNGSTTDYLLRLRRADGQPIWLELTATVAEPDDAAGLSGGVLIEALLRDVSERRKLDHQARELQQQLLQAEKMASLGQTVSGIAHELNNPLANIMSWAERLAGKPLDAAVQQGLDTILNEAERAARIVRHLLSFARKRQTTRAIIDVNSVIRETLALRAYEQQLANIRVVPALAAGLPQVFADSHQIQQVLLNLIINAEQAMAAAHGHGTLVVRTWLDPELDSVTIEINDDGPGIAEDVQPKIFDPFFTTKDVGEGTGLGLTVAYAIVNEHGGRLRLESRPSAGASFYIELPVSQGPAAPRPVRRPRAPVRAERPASILVVEDETALASAVVEALRDAGHSVVHAGDGAEALVAMKDHEFDLVICDVKMPRLDGQAFFRELSSASPALAQRSIFVTGDVTGADAAFLEGSGCRWLAKPFRLADLVTAVRENLTDLR